MPCQLLSYHTCLEVSTAYEQVHFAPLHALQVLQRLINGIQLTVAAALHRNLAATNSA